jgi:hypothetical protein
MLDTFVAVLVCTSMAGFAFWITDPNVDTAVFTDVVLEALTLPCAGQLGVLDTEFAVVLTRPNTTVTDRVAWRHINSTVAPRPECITHASTEPVLMGMSGTLFTVLRRLPCTAIAFGITDFIDEDVTEVAFPEGVAGAVAVFVGMGVWYALDASVLVRSCAAEVLITHAVAATRVGAQRTVLSNPRLLTYAFSAGVPISMWDALDTVRSLLPYTPVLTLRVAPVSKHIHPTVLPSPVAIADTLTCRGLVRMWLAVVAAIRSRA